MTAPEKTARASARPGTPDRPVLEQPRRRRVLPAADRILREAQAIDAWLTARRDRERALQARANSRDERMDLARELEVLQRTHDAIKERCARGLEADMDSFEAPGATAVIAHRHAWFVDKLTLLLDERGVTVLLSTDNGAEALGAVVAEQPDLVLVGGRLAMMHGRTLLAESRLYAPDALLAAQASDPQEGEKLRGEVGSVFLRHHTPAIVADALVALFTTTTREATAAGSPDGSCS